MKRAFSYLSHYAAHPFVKGSAIMFGGTMIANVLAYLYHLVVGRILGPVGYGELAALISIFYILNSPSIVVQNILVKFFSQLKAKRDYGQAKRLFLRITRLLAIAFRQSVRHRAERQQRHLAEVHQRHLCGVCVLFGKGLLFHRVHLYGNTLRSPPSPTNHA